MSETPNQQYAVQSLQHRRGGTALITVLILAGLMMFGFFKAREIGEGSSGRVKYETTVSAEILLGFYRRWLVEEQYQFQENDAVQSSDSAYFSLLGEHKETGRSINMGITE